MADDDAGVGKAFAELIPEMQQCAALVTSGARGREKKRMRVIDALFAEVGAYVRGRRGDPAYGIGDQIGDLASTGRALPSKQATAIGALSRLGYALEAAWDRQSGRGDAEDVLKLIDEARKLAREAQGAPAKGPNPGDVRARVERLAPGDDRELSLLTAIVVEHRLVELVEPIMGRLGLIDDTETIDHCVRALGRLYPNALAFADVCARVCASPNVGSRRWAARAMISGLRAAHADALIPLLADDEPKVRREAATVLRAMAIWHPTTREPIERAVDAALARFASDGALKELRSSLSAPPPTTS